MSPSLEQIQQLPVAFRIRMLSGANTWQTEAVPELGVGPALLADGPHGMRVEVGADEADGRSRPATCFPTAATLANTWDEALLAEVGAAVGAEAAEQGVDLVLGPGMNIKRHPLCGRNFEYFSEDPLLSGRLAAAMVRGIQHAGPGACVKHFAVNNQESHRLVVDAVVDERTLREIYLTGFEIAMAAKPAAVMAAYNRVNGDYACEHPQLLTDILRGEWGYDGVVVSDWSATRDRAAGLRAGLDLEMPGSGGLNDAEVLAALRAGRISEADVDAAVQRVLALAGRRGEGSGGRDSAQHRHALARRIAARATVLLSNDGTLPLAAPASVAVIGAFAEEPRFQGAGSSQVNPTQVDALLPQLRRRLGDAAVSYARGYDPVASEPDDALISEATTAARSADVAILLIGLPSRYESEGFDRRDLRLPAQHDLLVDAVCAANPRTVVAVSHGAPVAMPWAQRPAAILDCYLGGQAGGAALADVLLGTEPPAGRLAESVPIHHTDASSDSWFPGLPRQVQYREGVYVGYRYYDTVGAEVRFPFGHGLSYTSVDYGSLRVTPDAVAVTEPASLTAGIAPQPAPADGSGGVVAVVQQVTNSGSRPGTEVVQVYVSAAESGPARPEQELAGFATIDLVPGQTEQVRIDLPARAFAHYDTAAGRWAVAPGRYQVRVGASSRDIRATATLTVGALPTEPPAGPSPEAARPMPDRDPRAVDDAAFQRLLGKPIPRPTPARPFTRDSPLEDLAGHWLGRFVLAGVHRAATPAIRHVAGADPVMQAMLWQTAREAPVRMVAQLSGGRVGWPAVDAVLDVLNGNVGSLAHRARARMRRR